MSRRLNIGFIGAGFIGQLAHLMNYVEIERCQVLAVAEFRPRLRQKVAERYGIPRPYATHEELLRDPDIEAVVVVTPRAYTAPVVLDCLRAGKHVLSEKPMAGTAAQAAGLVEAARAKNLVYSVGYMKRCDEGVQTAKRLLDDALASGELGPIRYVRAHCFMGDSYCKAAGHVVTDEKPDYPDGGWPVAPDWLRDESRKPFAAYVNTYSHNTNLLRYFLGRSPTLAFSRMNAEAAQVAVLDFGPFAATLETGRLSDRGWDEVTEIFFQDGRLTVRTPPALLKNVPASVELYKAGAIQQKISPQCNWTWAFRRQAEAFVAAILDGAPVPSPGADAIEDLRLIEAIWAADPRQVNPASPPSERSPA